MQLRYRRWVRVSIHYGKREKQGRVMRYYGIIEFSFWE